MVQPPPRQTKRQKKALAFRSRQKPSKRQNRTLDDGEDALDFPIDENQDLAGLANIPLEAEEVSAGDRSNGREGKAEDGGQRQPQPGSSKKRKREDGGVVKKAQKKSKVHPTPTESSPEDGDGQKSAEVKRKVQPQRFILFAGNLKYSTTKDAILSHFSSCDPQPTVRLPTPKTTQSSKSNGYAFLEFTDKKALQQALRLHHSELEGRKINVELTAGGGGKSEHRVKKLQERNKGLHEQRKRRIDKQKSASTNARETNQSEMRALERPQRYSTTSGFGQAPSNKKTWSIFTAEDQEVAKNPKKRRRPTKPKDQSTGVNAIPVY